MRPGDFLDFLEDDFLLCFFLCLGDLGVGVDCTEGVSVAVVETDDSSLSRSSG